MSTVMQTLATFILVTLIGGAIAQRWQRASWFKQQRFLGREKEYEALKLVSEEISILGARRLFASRRLLSALEADSSELFEESVKQYGEMVALWMERLQSFYVRLTLYALYEYCVIPLEKRVHGRFYLIGRKLEAAVRLRRKTKVSFRDTSGISNLLDELEGVLFDYNRDLLNRVEKKRVEMYYGVSISYSTFTLEKLTSWELFQCLFKSKIDRLSVFRASFDLASPIETR